MRLHVGCCAWAGFAGCWQVDGWLEESKKTHSQQLTAVRTCMQVAIETRVRLRRRVLILCDHA